MITCGIDAVASDRMCVGILARCPFGLRERVLPAEPIPVVDGEDEREDVGPVADRRDVGNREQWEARRFASPMAKQDHLAYVNTIGGGLAESQ